MPQKLRPDIDEYFLKIAKVVGERATCVRRQIGALAVKDNQIIATGYNGAPSGMEDCLELGCLRDQHSIPSGAPHGICRSVHAEQNVIIQAATHGVVLKGATLYCTTAPCALCARMLVNAGIKRYVCYIDYPNKEASNLFKIAGINFDIIEPPTFKISEISERVLAISNDNFMEMGGFVGFKAFDKKYYSTLLSSVKYVDRDDAETSDAWKQIIPYVLVHKDDTYLVLQRLPRSGEKRLHNAYTFGVGGHINPIDSGSSNEGSDVIERGMNRELNEEVWIKDLKSIELVGFIYDDQQEVSRHHIGIVYDARIDSLDVEILEKDKLKPEFVKKVDLANYIDGKENWAEISLNDYILKN